MMRNPRWAVRITHIPTGIVVVRDSNHFRHQYQARDAALRYLKSRLYFTDVVDEDIKFSYTLPDGEEFPKDLSKYKEIVEEDK